MRRAARSLEALLLVAGHVSLASLVRADEIYLTSGEALKGLVVEEHVDRLVVSTVDGERVVWRREIDDVFFDDPERNYLYLGHEVLAQGDGGAAVALFRKARQLTPQWEAARDALQQVEDQRLKTAAGWTVDDPEGVLWTSWGVRLAATDHDPVVAALAPRQAAAVAGVHVGDRLVAVWGASMGFRPLAQVAERLLGPPGTTVTVTIQREIALPAGTVPPPVGLTMAPPGLTVSRVSPAGASAGVEAGDLIVTLDGRPTRYLPIASARAAISRAEKDRIPVQIQRHLVIIRPTRRGE